MKILVVNFLRLGDIFMSAPLVNAIQKKHPTAKIHFLGFRESSAAVRLLQHIQSSHFLSRGAIQGSAKDSAQGLFGSVDQINSMVEKMKAEKFDFIYNLSHTHFSSLFIDAIQLNAAQPISVFGQSFIHHKTPLHRHHFLDWYRIGLGLETMFVDWSYHTPFQSESEQRRRLYLFQTLSSDVKKAWSLEKWIQLLLSVRRRDPLAELKILAAPSEVDLLKELVERTGAQLLAVSLSEALVWIQRANYFVTLDTSTKHLANSSNCHLIELSIGSADRLKQAIYKRGALILSSTSSCHPCSATENCPMVRRNCVSDIEVSDVLNAIDYFEGKRDVSFGCRADVTTTERIWNFKQMKTQKGVLNEDRTPKRTQSFEDHREA